MVIVKPLNLQVQGRRQVNQYVFIKKLGAGAFGKVKLACLYDDPTQQYVRLTLLFNS